MKFDTHKAKASTCTKISAAQVYLMDNRSIPATAPGWEVPNMAAPYDADHEDYDDDNISGGRQVMYEPMVVFTPVYASVRQQQHNQGPAADGGRSLLSWPGVKEVLSKLEALTLGSAEDEDNNNNKAPAVAARNLPSHETRDETVTGRYNLRGNRKSESSSTLALPESVVSSVAKTPASNAATHHLSMAGADSYPNAIRRSPRFHHPDVATSAPTTGEQPFRPTGYATRSSNPFGY